MATKATIHDITFGTGHSIYKDLLLPAIEQAESEVLLITCFWAASETRNALTESLLFLNHKSLQQGHKIRVRIGFSSSSLFQKIFHTSSPAGQTYGPSQWRKNLGLPSPEELSGLDLETKSIFFLPFSVWHPKFVVVDRKKVFLPSCNVSWEDWFEGCVHMTGDVVQDFVKFWGENWANAGDEELRGQPMAIDGPRAGLDVEPESGTLVNGVECKFLPSPHHRNPRFRFPWQQTAPPPMTPLNTELLHLLATAKRSIYIQSPNITCEAVLLALIDASKRGVHITIITSERLMILEQLVTAGTATSRCVQRLIKQHRAVLAKAVDVEAGVARPGALRISYYHPRANSDIGSGGPVQSHLKLTVVDESISVFGSGNMDRASWYTSQELGVAFHSTEISQKAMVKLRNKMKGRSKIVYDSANSGALT